MTATIEKPRALSVDLANSDRHCHLVSDVNPSVALCGATKRRHPAEGQEVFPDPPKRCPLCGHPTCPTCLSIWRTFSRTGAWEGP